MEQKLIAQIQKGNREAFEQLYHRYAEYALRVATAITKSRTFAADAVQETFIRIYKNIQSFDRSRPFKPWFYRILINECHRFLEKKGKLIPTDHHWDNDLNLAQADQHDFEQYEDLYQAIGRLGDLYRIPIILKYLNEFSEKEIAELLELNQNTVKSRLLKGRQMLREEMERLSAKEGLSNGREKI
ncbi:RNA polymerase sigma factor [Bacillus horti]|uniref:RNA polymerase sigma-70 factor (ECF subfamily) n=1 Tax=Caldalkalibacillus horti TaxID=77523 RepID=A0ABT9W1X9_9BACI|nr:sigma-70 family RNA polymerase sigma factor [Bacillus horti]MDQ0167263.1 RNA polymerase sigma-70 factor (ECF subfamily) [Bacillus horti]